MKMAIWVKFFAIFVLISFAKCEVQRLSWPAYFAHLEIPTGKNGSIRCGGTFVRENKVITTAYCFTKDFREMIDEKYWRGEKIKCDHVIYGGCEN